MHTQRAGINALVARDAERKELTCDGLIDGASPKQHLKVSWVDAVLSSADTARALCDPQLWGQWQTPLRYSAAASVAYVLTSYSLRVRSGCVLPSQVCTFALARLEMLDCKT
jgi:hypothetical protein